MRSVGRYVAIAAISAGAACHSHQPGQVRFDDTAVMVPYTILPGQQLVVFLKGDTLWRTADVTTLKRCLGIRVIMDSTGGADSVGAHRASFFYSFANVDSASWLIAPDAGTPVPPKELERLSACIN